MRPLSFRSDALRALLLHNKIATLDELKQVLATPVDVTVQVMASLAEIESKRVAIQKAYLVSCVKRISRRASARPAPSRARLVLSALETRRRERSGNTG